MDRSYFVQEYGISVNDFLVGLRCLGRNQMARTIGDTEHAQMYYLTGLAYHSAEKLIEWFEDWISDYAQKRQVDRPAVLAKDFFRQFTLHRDSVGLLDMRDSRLRSFLIGYGPYIIVDWLSLMDFLVHIADNVTSRSEMSNIKGPQYEADLLFWLRDKVPNLRTLFCPNKELRLNESLFGEADLAFRADPYAFLVDCKAYSVNSALLRGERRATTARWDYTERWLSQVLKTSQKLAENPIGDNYSVATGIKHLVPLVCSPHVEPVFDYDDKHFVLPGQPRICTPLELVSILTQSPSPMFESNQFTFTIQDCNKPGKG